MKLREYLKKPELFEAVQDALLGKSFRVEKAKQKKIKEMLAIFVSLVVIYFMVL